MQNKAVVFGAGPPEGIGAAVARRFAHEGLHVFISGRNIEKVEQSAEQIRSPVVQQKRSRWM